MAADVLETFIRDYIMSQVRAGQREIWFAWQGGEPTLLGLDCFRTIVALQQRHAPAGIAIRNALQANGTLLGEDWAWFLHEAQFLVGLSLDGPPHLHDHYRRDRRDLPSSPRVLVAWQLLTRQKVETTVLCVMNRRNATAALEVYRYLRGIGVRFIQFIPVVERLGPAGQLAGPPGSGDDTDYPIAPWSVRPRDYERFLCTVFDEWVRHDVSEVFVRFFDVQLGLWMGQPAGLGVFAETCGAGLELEHNGDVYACDHYVYADYRLGNLTQTRLDMLAASPRQRQFGLDKAARLPVVCRTCQWRFVCNGGCPKHRFLPAQADDPERLNYFCEANRMFFTHAAPYLSAMARLLAQRRPAAEIMPMLPQPAPARNAPCPCGSGTKFKQCCGR